MAEASRNGSISFKEAVAHLPDPARHRAIYMGVMRGKTSDPDHRALYEKLRGTWSSVDFTQMQLITPEEIKLRKVNPGYTNLLISRGPLGAALHLGKQTGDNPAVLTVLVTAGHFETAAEFERQVNGDTTRARELDLLAELIPRR